MRRTLHRLTALALRRATAPGYLGDGGGLYLQTTEAGSQSWIFRYSLHGRRREMGLGAHPDIGLAEARNLAAEKRGLVAAGTDPIDDREAQRARQRLEGARAVTFEQAVSRFLADHEGTWKNDKHRQQWRNTLATYAYPKIGSLSVGAIGKPEVTRILDPIWKAKPETAFRVRGRIERVLDWAKARGYRTGENPARWRGHLDAVYPARSKVRKVKHHTAVPVDEMPAVYQRLAEAKGIAALAARFTILTAVRAGETVGATWPEFEWKAAVWSISAERMKSDRDHRVPLSREALAILKELYETRVGDRVFPGHRAGRPLSHTALIKALRAAGAGKATTHGGRSTFKDWASERTSFPSEVSEMALAHVIDDKTEAAYRRGELLEKRRAMMQQWARFLLAPASSDKIVPLQGRRG